MKKVIKLIKTLIPVLILMSCKNSTSTTSFKWVEKRQEYVKTQHVHSLEYYCSNDWYDAISGIDADKMIVYRKFLKDPEYIDSIRHRIPLDSLISEIKSCAYELKKKDGFVYDAQHKGCFLTFQVSDTTSYTVDQEMADTTCLVEKWI